jgi:transcriptional regulator with XRE-family HTH domain
MKDSIFLKEMGSKIKVARIANRLSYPQLSRLTGLSVPALWFIENGRRNPHILTLKVIAEVLKIDLRDLL